MVLDRHRRAIDWLILPLSRACRRVDPNHITWISLLFAIAAGAFYLLSDPATEATRHFLPLALTGVVVASVLDLMDGKIAVLYDKASAKGDYLDHCIDRFSDVVIFAGIALSPWADVRVGLFAIGGVLLTSYMGTQAQAVGIGRDYGGILGRADRLVLLIAATLVDIVRVQVGYEIPAQYHVTSALGVLLWWYALAGNFTAVQRFVSGLRWFDEEKRRQ